MIRPGPAALDPAQYPGGVVLHTYAVPTERLLLTRNLRPDDAVELAAALDVDDCFGRLRTGEIAVCLVAYDGDTGERCTAWGEDMMVIE